MVTSTKATMLIGPYTASAAGRANTPVPITEPMTNAVAVGSPNFPGSCRGSAAGLVGSGGDGDLVLAVSVDTGSPHIE
jgi:hypothetical protein